MSNIEYLIKAYIKYWDDYIGQEEYKWNALVHFQRNWKSSTPIETRIALSFKEAKNLLNSQYYTPRSMLKKVSIKKPKEVEALMSSLYNENSPLDDRVQDFMTGFEDLVFIIAQEQDNDWDWLKKYENNKLNTYQDPHAVSVYLFMRYPEKHYIYKSTLFDKFANLIGYTIHEKDRVKKYLEFEQLCDVVKKELLTETYFINNTYAKWLESKSYIDPDYNLLTQDFIYTICIHLNGSYWAGAGKIKPKVISEKVISANMVKASTIRPKSKRIVQDVDYWNVYQRNKLIGLNGEYWVMEYEKKRLKKLGINFDIEHTSIVRGDGCGYDILSVEDDGVTERYIEVKTTTADEHQSFFFTDNELRFSLQHSEHYYLYRVYDYKPDTKAASVNIIKGGLDDLNAQPISFTATI